MNEFNNKQKHKQLEMEENNLLFIKYVEHFCALFRNSGKSL